MGWFLVTITLHTAVFVIVDGAGVSRVSPHFFKRERERGLTSCWDDCVTFDFDILDMPSQYKKIGAGVLEPNVFHTTRNKHPAKKVFFERNFLRDPVLWQKHRLNFLDSEQ